LPSTDFVLVCGFFWSGKIGRILQGDGNHGMSFILAHITTQSNRLISAPLFCSLTAPRPDLEALVLIDWVFESFLI